MNISQIKDLSTFNYLLNKKIFSYTFISKECKLAKTINKIASQISKNQKFLDYYFLYQNFWFVSYDNKSTLKISNLSHNLKKAIHIK